MDSAVSVLKDTWDFYTTHLGRLILVLLPILVPLEILEIALYASVPGAEDQLWPSTLIMLLSFPIYQGVLVVYIGVAAAGEQLRTREYYQYSLALWSRLIVLYSIIWIAVSCGLLLLIIPGLIIAARLAFAEFYCVLERQPTFAAMQTSWHQTREHIWTLIGGMVVIMLLIIAPIALVSSLIENELNSNQIYYAIASIIGYLLYIPITIFCFRVYLLHQANTPTETQSGF